MQERGIDRGSYTANVLLLVKLALLATAAAFGYQLVARPASAGPPLLDSVLDGLAKATL